MKRGSGAPTSRVTLSRPACERYCRKQRELLRQLEDLAASERAMYELDHAKDQTMTVLKLALANLVMWTRDHHFPAAYAQATWHRLAPFFCLPGRVVWGAEIVTVELARSLIASSTEICTCCVTGSQRPNRTCLTGDDCASLLQAWGVTGQLASTATWRDTLLVSGATWRASLTRPSAANSQARV